MSADTILAEAAHRGLLLSNLLQLRNVDTQKLFWRANFVGGQFGNADTPQEALRLALASVPAHDEFKDLLG